MAILHTQWWPFRAELGGGCSLADSVQCDIRKDSFALTTALVTQWYLYQFGPVWWWNLTAGKLGFFKLWALLTSSFAWNACAVLQRQEARSSSSKTHDFDYCSSSFRGQSGCLCRSALFADMLPFSLGGERVFLILFMIPRLLLLLSTSHRHVASKSLLPACIINDLTVVETETIMASPALTMTFCVFSHAPADPHPLLRPLIMWVNGSWSWSAFKRRQPSMLFHSDALSCECPRVFHQWRLSFTCLSCSAMASTNSLPALSADHLSIQAAVHKHLLGVFFLCFKSLHSRC